MSAKASVLSSRFSPEIDACRPVAALYLQPVVLDPAFTGGGGSWTFGNISAHALTLQRRFTQSGTGSQDVSAPAPGSDSWILDWQYTCPRGVSSDASRIEVTNGARSGMAAVYQSPVGNDFIQAFYGNGPVSLRIATPCAWTVTIYGDPAM